MTPRSFEPSAPRSAVRAELDGDLDTLRDLADDPDPTVRTLALGSLSRLDELDDARVGGALIDPDHRVRVRAIELAVGRPSIELTPLLADDHDLVCETAAWALGEREQSPDSVVDALAAVARDHEVSIYREAAVAALGALGSERGLPAILAALGDRAPVRRRAVLALAPFEGPDVHAALTAALEDRDRQVRQAAEDLL